MIEFMVRENSSFTDEGKNLLIEEFGKNYATYFSILSAISGGINTQPEIYNFSSPFTILFLLSLFPTLFLYVDPAHLSLKGTMRVCLQTDYFDWA